MKFYQATTTAALQLSAIFTDEKRTFPPGTEVSATEAGPNRWHLNTMGKSETFEGYADGMALQLGVVIATCNEGK